MSRTLPFRGNSGANFRPYYGFGVLAERALHQGYDYARRYYSSRTAYGHAKDLQRAYRKAIGYLYPRRSRPRYGIVSGFSSSSYRKGMPRRYKRTGRYSRYTSRRSTGRYRKTSRYSPYRRYSRRVRYPGRFSAFNISQYNRAVGLSHFRRWDNRSRRFSHPRSGWNNRRQGHRHRLSTGGHFRN